MKKQIKRISAFKEGGYYSFVYTSPQASPSDPAYFFIIKMTKQGDITNKRDDGVEENCTLSELKKSLALDYIEYFHSDKESFVKALRRSIKGRQNEIKMKQDLVSDLKKFILNLPKT
jgi:hypothetical protein